MNLPIRKTMCATCPWQNKSPYACLLPDLTASATTEASRICHNTGEDNGIHEHTGKPEHICRGARDLQLRMFASLGYLPEPTDKAWNDARVLIGMERVTIKDPQEQP